MKMKWFVCVCCCVLPAVLLCGCNTEPPESTVIDGGPSMSLATTTTTTTTTPTSSSDVMRPDASGDASQPSSSTSSSATTTTGTLPSVDVGDADPNDTGVKIAQLAVSLIGTEFEFGANGPDAFDNPSFVVYCYKQFGYTVPRKASSMASFGQEVAKSDMKAGDILLFCDDLENGNGVPDFCGIYIGDNRFVSCNNPSSPTKSQKLNVSYWQERLVSVRRPAAQ